MSCAEFGNEIHAYHDGELSPARAEQFESHVANCPSCQRQLNSLQALSDVLSTNAPVMQVSYDALQRLHDDVDRTLDRTLMPLAGSLVGIAAAVLIAATAGLLQLRQPRTSAPQPWEGTVFTASSGSSQQADLSQQGGSGSSIDPEIIVADLSRPSMH